MVTISRRWFSWIALGLICVLFVSCAAPAAAPAPTSAPAAAPTKAPAAPAATTSAAVPAATTSAAAPAASTAPAVPTGALRIGVEALGTEALDPMMASISGNFYLALMYDYLVGTTWDGKLSKDTGLATDWQQSADGMTWTFKLRKGVKFQNGDEATAEDFKFSLERAMSPKSRLGNASTTRAVVASVDAPDPSTVVVNMKRSYATFPYFMSKMMGSHEGAIAPKKYIQQIGEDNFNAKPVGSGPYKLVEFQPGSKLVFEAVPNHWRIGVPKYKTITINLIGESSTLIAGLKRSELDIIAVPVTLLKEVSGFPISEKKGSVPIGLHVNQQWEDYPYKDVRVRQALAEAIDRKAINDTLSAGMGVMNYIGPIGGSNWALGYPTLKEIPFDPNHAKQLLKDAGFAQGFDIDLYQVPRAGGYDLAKMAEMISEYWRAIGVNAAIKKTDYATLKPLWTSFKLPNSVWLNASQAFPLVDATLQTCFGSDGTATGVHDPKLDALIKTLQSQSKTLDDYGKNQGAVLQYMRDNYNSIGLIVGSEYFATSAAFKGWDPGRLTSFLDFDSLVTRK